MTKLPFFVQRLQQLKAEYNWGGFLGHCQVLDKYVLFFDRFGPATTTVGGVVCLKTGCLSGRMSGCDYGGKWVRCSFYLDPWHRTIVTIAASAQDINCYVYLWHGITIPPPVPGVPTCSAGLQMHGKTFCSTLLCITLLSGEVLLLAQGPTLAPHKDSLSFASERQLLQIRPIVFLFFLLYDHDCTSPRNFTCVILRNNLIIP